LPGPRKKQAEALTQNILWMAETFGKERIGFLTLTWAIWMRAEDSATCETGRKRKGVSIR
jgi:hypothetical protein